MEKREKKIRKKQNRKRPLWGWLICAAVIICGIYVWFLGAKITPLPSAVQEKLYPVEETPLPEATPEPAPELTPEPTLYIPKPEVSIYTAKLTVGEGIIYGSMQLHYVNSGEDTLYAIPLHLYPNTVTPDVLKVNKLSLDGKEAYFKVDGDILNVPLAVELEQGDDCVIYMEFSVDFYAGEYGGERMLPYVLPAAGVYENGWITDAAPEDVTFTAPAVYSVIIEGDVEECSIPKAGEGYYYGENVQGLSITLG